MGADALKVERDENDQRKEPTVSEKVALAEAIAERLQGRQGRPEKGGNISTISDDAGKTRDIAAKKSGLGSGKTCSTPGACNTTQRTAYKVQPGREHDSPRRARSARQRGHFATRGDRQAGQTRDIALRKAGPCIPRKTAPFRGHAQRWNRPVTGPERMDF
ncbi:hypothetical protein ebA809 [Aromatoleum aromaticum EbN1]|uniref:Uncharacterized protein n=1 Tax=Aromatoleum aromaticum (strain DSM 19018 / LMG 30748 / EbN1) TaxID=76114 RepID=Q5P815_AROAE|nr:hypothetical protein [Aromatoleum aromaticum]CAI06546.1 hypothetical protein ebA809 [Aromatoleum aromaticum EbN1]